MSLRRCTASEITLVAAVDRVLTQLAAVAFRQVQYFVNDVHHELAGDQLLVMRLLCTAFANLHARLPPHVAHAFHTGGDDRVVTFFPSRMASFSQQVVLESHVAECVDVSTIDNVNPAAEGRLEVGSDLLLNPAPYPWCQRESCFPNPPGIHQVQVFQIAPHLLVDGLVLVINPQWIFILARLDIFEEGDAVLSMVLPLVVADGHGLSLKHIKAC
mmetsp:Transcript_100165/g.238859  ORF Transcript_100165/g.238859 Transcript_100165/m.238859 type:complete len:215 (-) Transcript_100165:849-1493(-)